MIQEEEIESHIRGQISWYESISLDELNQQKSYLQAKNKNLLEERAASVKKVETLLLDIKKINNLLKSKLKWDYWFSDEQRKHRKKLKQLSSSIKQHKIAVKRIDQNISELDRQLTDIESEAYRFKEFDIEKATADATRQKEKVAEIRSNKTVAEKIKESINQHIFVLVVEIEKLRSRKTRLQGDLHDIEQVERDLSKAANSRERAILHRQCEVSFGEGNPRKLISLKSGELRSVESALSKCLRRTNEIVSMHTRAIERVIIDGSNLCFERGDNFVGLGPVIKAAEIISDSYDVLVVFDASMIRSLDISEKDLSDKFVDNKAEVHIASNAQGADETILTLASLKESYYILSNDKFSEYPDFDVVKSNRLIKHDVVGDHIFIQSLGISSPWS